MDYEIDCYKVRWWDDLEEEREKLFENEYQALNYAERKSKDGYKVALFKVMYAIL